LLNFVIARYFFLKQRLLLKLIDLQTYFCLMKKFIYIVFIFYFTLTLAGQPVKYGFLGVTNYNKSHYNIKTQLRSIKQGLNGIMYFGTNKGLLSYDGTEWDMIELPRYNSVRSLDMDATGTVYIGSQGDFGYLKSSHSGKHGFVSLIPLLAASDLNFRDVWKTTAHTEGIFFQTQNKVYLYKSDSIRTYSFPNRLSFDFIFDSHYYLYSAENEKLYRFNKNKFDTIALPNSIKNYKIYGVVPFKSDELILFTELHGPVIYSLNSVPKQKDSRILSPKLAQFFNRYPCTSGSVLPDGNIVLGTNGSGILIINTNGEIVENLNENSGLLSDKIDNILTDGEGQIWALTEKGISHIEYNSPFRYLRGVKSPVGSLNAMLSPINKNFNKSLYIGTSNGLYTLSTYNINKPATLQTIEDFELKRFQLNTSVNKFLEFKNTVFVATDQGLYTICNNKLQKAGGYFTAKIQNIQLYKGKYLLANDKNFIYVFNIFKSGIGYNVSFKKKFISTHDQFANFAIDTLNRIITAVPGVGISTYRLSNDMQNILKIKLYTKQNGSSASNFPTKPVMNRNSLYCLSIDGILKYDYRTDKFVMDTTLNKAAYGLAYNELVTDANKDYWLIDEKQNRVWHLANSNKQLKNEQLFVNRLRNEYVNFLYTDNCCNVYIGTENGIVIYNANFPKQTIPDFPVLIREAYTYSNNDTAKVLIGKSQFTDYTFTNPIKIQHTENALKFKVSAPSYIGEDVNKYSYFLEGFDVRWSEFTTIPTKEYTYLPSGKYTFKVVAMNAFGIKSKVNSFAFEITPPIWLTVPAFIFYIILLVITVYALIKANAYRLEMESKKLKKKVLERTLELQNQQNLLIATNEELLAKQEEITSQTERLALQNKELEQLQIAVTETDNGILILSSKGEIEWVNDSFSQTFEFMLSSGSTSVPAYLSTGFNKVLETGSSVSFETLNTDNEKLWKQTTLSPIFSETAEIEHIVAIESDITKLKNAEAQISRQNDDITAGIRYAQTIQSALLPPLQNFTKWFDNFIIYLPKDIVSGDFYRHTRIENDTEFGLHLIIVADCTGHGVPGAFMSMIGIQMLNEIISEHNIVSPAEILAELDYRIINSLHQKTNSNRDGMDVAIISIEKIGEQYRILFSNAKRPLFYKNTSDDDVKIIQATRRSIGGDFFVSTTPFVNYELLLEPNSFIYMLTDGYSDSPTDERKRLGKRKLHEMLNEIHVFPFSVQEEIIADAILTSKSGEEQRDDITFLALKLR